MAQLSTAKPAPGGPGIGATWAQGDKDGVGTARSDASPVWFTIAAGVVNEVYYPTVDTPQIRDLQLLVTDGSSFFHDSRRDFRHELRLIQPGALGYVLTNTALDQPYSIVQTIVSNPDAPCLLVRCHIEAAADFLSRLRVFALLAPHVNGHGNGNSGYVCRSLGRDILVAQRGPGPWLALDVDTGFARTSCGFVGVNDGWTDIVGHRRAPVFDFDCALGGNVAMTGEIDLAKSATFTLGLAFGDSWPHEPGPPKYHVSNPHNALVALNESLSRPFDGPDGHVSRFLQSWARANPHAFRPKPGTTSDQDALFGFSRDVLLAHEDKVSSGALVASMSIPWGEYNGDQDGGYHMVWPRDMSQSATALIAAGETDLPLRGLMFLAASQQPDGRFYQRFFINGDWDGDAQQLDEYSFPMVLAYRLKTRGALQRFDPKAMVLKAAGAMIADGPMTAQERWEEIEGYSPSTLAINIASLVCAADFADDDATKQFLLEYADFLETKLEAWTVTTKGTLHPQVARHFIRILPTNKWGGNATAPFSDEDPDTAPIGIGNVIPPPGGYMARDIVDGGFLELVRYGIRKATDPLVVDSLKVVDLSLKDALPQGPCWRRYTHDGYGQTDEGGPFSMDEPYRNKGIGRPWPILTGERGHYELAAGGSASLYLKAMEGFSGKAGLLPEQLWNRDVTPPGTRLVKGGATGSAVPLAWAHAEYIKLVRSASDGAVFDRIDIVADRYLKPHDPSPLEVWNFNRRVQRVARGKTIRVLSAQPFRLHWSPDGWRTTHDGMAIATAVGISYVDIATSGVSTGGVVFTFYWVAEDRWEGRDFTVQLSDPS